MKLTQKQRQRFRRNKHKGTHFSKALMIEYIALAELYNDYEWLNDWRTTKWKQYYNIS